VGGVSLRIVTRGKGDGTLRNHYEGLPYFDETGNEYVEELIRQDAFMRRGGKLSAAQQIKYENRVAMLSERLVLIHNAVENDPDALRDYMSSIEESHRSGRLPRQVYFRFKDELQKEEPHRSVLSERERDRQRVIRGEARAEESNLSDLSVDQLLEMYRQKDISRDVLFQQLFKRESAGLRLQRMERDLWGRYRTWVAEQRRRRRTIHGSHER